MTSSHFRNYLRSVPCALKDLAARALQSVINAVQLLMYFAGIFGSDHCHTCDLLIFIIQLVLTLLLYLPAEHHHACTIVCPVVVYHIQVIMNNE